MKYYQGSQLLLLNFALGLGTFIQILDSSIANVAIPYIAGNLSVSADEGTWVITSFAASNAVVLPLTGWLAGTFGRVRLFVWSVLLFALVSFACGFSTSLAMLVTFRVLQGAVAGSLIPLSQSILMTSNPPENQGSALGFWAMIVVVAPVLGPIIGGYLTEEYSWPWIFYINVPIGIFSASVTWYFLKDEKEVLEHNPIDWRGLLLLSIGVGSLQIMLDKGKDLDWFESNVIIALTVISAVSLTYFTIWNIYQKYPIVDFSFFRSRNFTLGTIAITIGYLLYFTSAVTVPLWLQTEQNYTAYWAGVAIAPVGVMSVFFATLVGNYMDRFDLRKIVAMSFTFFSISFIYQAQFTTQVSLNQVMFSRFLQGFGVLFFFLPLVQLSLAEVPAARLPSATGLFHFIRILVGSGFGTSLAIELWTRREIFHHARLAESINFSRNVVTEAFAELGPYAAPVIDRQVEQQAFMLSTNDLAWGAAVLFLLMIPMLFFLKRYKTSVQAAGIHVPH